MICWVLSAISSVSVFLFSCVVYAHASLDVQIQEAVQLYILNHMPWRSDDVRIKITNNAQALQGLQKQKARLEIEKIGTGDYVGDVAFLCRITDSKGQKRSITVHALIEILRDVIVAADSLERNRLIGEQDLRVRKKWVRRIDPRLVTTMDQVVGKRSVTDIAAGTEITTSMIREPVLVKKGAVVRLELERGPIHISTLAISEEDGVHGSLVRIKNISSNRIIYAKVKGENYVVIDF